MTLTNTFKVWPPPRFPMIQQAKRVFRLQGREALIAWAGDLSYTQKEKLIKEIINFEAERRGLDPIEIALELFRGKGDEL